MKKSYPCPKCGNLLKVSGKIKSILGTKKVKIYVCIRCGYRTSFPETAEEQNHWRKLKERERKLRRKELVEKVARAICLNRTRKDFNMLSHGDQASFIKLSQRILVIIERKANTWQKR